MQKVGRVEFNDPKCILNFVWDSNNLDFERLDLIHDINTYNVIDSSSCTASYLRKGREFILGEDNLIKLFFNIKNQALVFQGESNTDYGVDERGMVITVHKEDPKIGYRHTLITINGLIHQELYQTPVGMIFVENVSNDKGVAIEPINSGDYKTFSLVDGEVGNYSDNVDYFSLHYLKSKYVLDHIDDKDYVVIASMEEAEERLSRFRRSPNILKSVDIETTGTDLHFRGLDKITGIVMSYDKEESTYYPFRQDKCEYNLPIEYMQKIVNTINNQPEDVKILAHNGKFEKQGFYNEGFDYIRIDVDTFLLSILVNPIMTRNLHTLKNRAWEATGNFFLELDNIFKGGEIRFNVLPPEIIKYYACPDAPNTIIVYEYLIKLLPKDEIGILNLESQLVEAKFSQEFYGIRTDKKLLVESIENEEYKVKALGEMFKKIHKISGNINSPDVRRDIFYNKLRCPVEVRTKTNRPSTSAIAVNRIVDIGTIREYDEAKVPPPICDLRGDPIIKGTELISNKYPSLVILSKYNKATKELGALKRIQRKSIVDRVTFNINQAGASSGRQTSDMHQCSDAMKSLMLSDSEEHYLWSTDYSQIELRVLAYLAGQLDLIEMESDPDIDIHRAILSIITGKEIWAISAKERQNGKSVNFGVVYMMSEYGLAKKKAGPAYTKEDLLEALKSIVDFYNGLPNIKEFVHQNEVKIKRDGYISTAFGRRRLFKEIFDQTLPAKKIQSIIRSGNNTPVQGFAADLMKMAENAITTYIKEKGWDQTVNVNGLELPLVRLMISIHDEVLVSSHKSVPIEELIKMFKVCMEIKIKGAPPFFASPALIPRWSAGKEDKYAIPTRLRDSIIEEWDNNGKSIIHAETYLEDLNKYRVGLLEEYMEDLVSKYKTKEEVSKHVRHPVFTHTLISVYIKKSEKLSHMESIDVAVERYMEDNKEALYKFNDDSVDDVKEESLSDFEELSEFIQFNDKGEAITEFNEYEDEEEEDNELDVLREYIPESLRIANREYAVYMADSVVIDLSDFGITELGEEVNQEIAKLCSPNEYYKVLYHFHGKNGLIETPMRIGYVRDKIDEIIKSRLERLI